MGGQMIDGSIIAAPGQRNNDAEEADLKAGRVPVDWAASRSMLRSILVLCFGAPSFVSPH
jgi:IS5 family transposase